MASKAPAWPGKALNRLEVVGIRILGLDPGAANIGWGIIDSGAGTVTVVAAGTMRPDGKHEPVRLRRLGDWARALKVSYGPMQAEGIEQLYLVAAGKVRQRINFHTGVLLGILGSPDTRMYPPQTIKAGIAGNGRAGKSEMAHAVCLHLGLRTAPEEWTEHTYDALAVALLRASEGRMDALAKAKERLDAAVRNIVESAKGGKTVDSRGRKRPAEAPQGGRGPRADEGRLHGG